MIEILELVKEGLNTKKFGICHVLVVLCSEKKISTKESREIEHILSENKPNPYNEYKEFTQNPYWGITKNGYWWSPIIDASATRQIRIDYIAKLIENLK